MNSGKQRKMGRKTTKRIKSGGNDLVSEQRDLHSFHNLNKNNWSSDRRPGLLRVLVVLVPLVGPALLAFSPQ